MKRTEKVLLASMLMMSAVVGSGSVTHAGTEIGVTWTGTEWDGSTEGSYPNRNCDIVSVGREQARVDSIPYADVDSARTSAAEYRKELSPYYQLLSGCEWKFSWYENPSAAEDGKDADFWRSDFDDSGWDSIAVPSVWQTEGYDYPIYTNTVQKFAKESGNDDIGYPRDLPKAPTVYNPTGLYRHSFDVSSQWEGRRVYIDFEGVDSAMYLWVNGIQAGYSEDSFTTHEFDITDYLNFGGTNTIAVKVLRWCDGSWIEDQDMFDLSGIFRDVYLYSTPQVRVRDFSVVTDFDDTFTDSTLEVEAAVRNYTREAAEASVTLHLFGADGAEVVLGEAATQSDLPENDPQQTLSLEAEDEECLSWALDVKTPHLWSAEDPYLYTLVLEETTAQGTVYESYPIGFRKITYKTNESGWYEGLTDDADLIRINGQPLTFRGVDRHETHPEYGYALTREVMEEDIRIMLENNINAVRTSHYPNDPYWYWLCDKYGIYVVDEANVECHSNMTTSNELLTENLSKAIIDREYSMVRRDRNHASVVMWSLGNENKNPEITRTILVQSYPDPEGEEQILHEYTKDRPWHYEQARDMTETGIDVVSGMYALPSELIEYGESDVSVPMIECEYEHAMGNSEGNFDEYWDAYLTYRNLQGGFIWDFIDQSVYLTNEDGEEYFGYGGDYGEAIDDGNFCANGLLLPDRTLQPEMAEVKYYYQQLYFEEEDLSRKQVRVNNWNLFTDPAEKYELHWSILKDGETVEEGVIADEDFHVDCVDARSNQAGTAVITVPFTTEISSDQNEYFLNLSVVLKEDCGLLKKGHEVAKEQFALNEENAFLEDEGNKQESFGNTFRCNWTEEAVVISSDGFEIRFDPESGALTRYRVNDRDLIVPDFGPEANFYRARTDNDTGFGYGLYIFNQAWKETGDYTVDVFDIMQVDGGVTVTVEGRYEDLNDLVYNTTYTIRKNGSIKVDTTIIPNYNDSLVYVPFAGLQMRIPADYENMTWYGRGPQENYADRQDGTKVGIWETTVTDNFFPYVKTSETGNHTDVRWVELTNKDGQGIRFTAVDTPLETSALHYTSDELDKHTHPYEIEMLADTVLRIGAVQIGVGGDNAWSKIVPHEQYLPHDERYEVSFVMEAVR